MLTGLRSLLLAGVEASTEPILALQQRKNLFLDSYFALATWAADTAFYTLVIPLLAWVIVPLHPTLVDESFPRLIALLLFTSVAIGCVVKDVCNLPRPPSPPVWRFKHETDCGFPSTHSLNGVAIPLFMVLAPQQHVIAHVDTVVLACVAFWGVSVAASRIYNGVHSFPDVVGGAAMGVAFALFFADRGESVHRWLRDAPNAFGVCVLVMALFLFYHPKPPTVSFGRNVTLCAFVLGVCYAERVASPHEHSLLMQYAIEVCRRPPAVVAALRAVMEPLVWLLAPRHLAAAALRLAVGFPLLGASILVCKYIGLLFYHAVRAVPPLRGCCRLVGELSKAVATPTYTYEFDRHAVVEKDLMDARDTRRALQAFAVPLVVFVLVPEMLNALKI